MYHDAYIEIIVDGTTYIVPLLDVDEDVPLPDKPGYTTVMFDGFSFYCPYTPFAWGFFKQIENRTVKFVFKAIEGKHTLFREFQGCVYQLRALSGEPGEILPIGFSVMNSTPITMYAKKNGLFGKWRLRKLEKIKTVQKVGD